VVVRTKIRGRWLVDGLAFTPMALPGVVLGVALIFVYLRSPVPIYGTIWILLIAYVTKYIPYGMRYSSSAMLQIGQELEEASAVSGAGLFKTLRRIDLPLLLPGLLSGWIFIVVSAMRELSTSLLVYSPGHEVLPVLIWSEYSDGQFGALAALGVVMIAILVALVFILLAIGRRTKGGFSIDAM
jgi:iron(III) transport system permease protein